MNTQIHFTNFDYLAIWSEYKYDLYSFYFHYGDIGSETCVFYLNGDPLTSWEFIYEEC